MKFLLSLLLVALLIGSALYVAPRGCGPGDRAATTWPGCIGVQEGETAEAHMLRCPACRAREARATKRLRDRGMIPTPKAQPADRQP